jgi:hypothetical protein
VYRCYATLHGCLVMATEEFRGAWQTTMEQWRNKDLQEKPTELRGNPVSVPRISQEKSKDRVWYPAVRISTCPPNSYEHLTTFFKLKDDVKCDNAALGLLFLSPVNSAQRNGYAIYETCLSNVIKIPMYLRSVLFWYITRRNIPEEHRSYHHRPGSHKIKTNVPFY